jgi:hypothetical protein
MNATLIAVIVAAVAYLPVFAPVYLEPRGIEVFNTFNYGILVLLGLLLLSLIPRSIGAGSPTPITGLQRMFLALNLYVVVVTIAFALIEGELYEGWRLVRVPFASLLLTMFVFRSGLAKQREVFFNRFVAIVAVLFMIQLALSVYESVTGQLLVARLIESRDYARLDEDRDLWSAFGGSQQSTLGFTVTLNGLYPQHGYWALQLGILNVMFATQFVRTRKPTYAVMALIVLMAAFGNGARHGVMGIVLADAIAVTTVLGKGSPARLLVFLGLTVTTLIWLAQPIWSNLLTLSAGAFPSFQNRIELWQGALDFYFSNDPFRVIFGSGVRASIDFGLGFLGTTYSMENQYLGMFVTYGVIGLVIFAVVFLWQPIKFFRSKSLAERTCSRMLWITLLVGASFTTSTFVATTYILLTACLLFTFEPAPKLAQLEIKRRIDRSIQSPRFTTQAAQRHPRAPTDDSFEPATLKLGDDRSGTLHGIRRGR